MRLMARQPVMRLADADAGVVMDLTAQENRRNPLIRKLEAFTSLSDADRAALERISADPRRVMPGTDLIREGDKPRGVFLILDGMAYRQKIRANGARQITAYMLPGDTGDLDAALLGEMDHTITTFSACEVVNIVPEVIAELMQQHPRIARALRRAILVDEGTLREWLMNIGCRTALERVAHLFCELLVRLQAVGCTNGNSYLLPVKQADLAATAGLSPVHLNRTLQELRRRGLIELKGGRLTILNLPALQAAAEFRSTYLHVRFQAAA